MPKVFDLQDITDLQKVGQGLLRRAPENPSCPTSKGVGQAPVGNVVLSHFGERRLPKSVSHWPSTLRSCFWDLMRQLNKMDKSSGRAPSPIQTQIAEEAIRRMVASNEE